jgi:hypothetical protein
MKLRIETSSNGETKVYLGETEIEGVQQVSFSASVDNLSGQALLVVSPVAVLAEIDGGLLDIECMPVNLVLQDKE